MEGETRSMHMVVIPWLAFGHLLPFLELSRRFAEKGHRVSFISTAKNIRSLPKLPPNLSSLVTFIEFRLPSVEHLPDGAESTIDLPTQSYSPLLHKAYDGFREQFSDFIRSCSPPPDWVLHDYAAHWAPAAAAEVGSAAAFVSLFNAATLGFFGRRREVKSLDDFITVPEWVPFPSTVCFRRYEITRLFSPPVLPDGTRLQVHNHFGADSAGGDAIVVRSSVELEPEWWKLLEELYTKPVIPLGLFPPLPKNYDNGDSPEQVKMLIRWLDERDDGEVVYAAFGTEAKLSKEEIEEILLGLEMSELPFVMVVRTPASFFPEGFRRRAEGRGVVLNGWVPQVIMKLYHT